MPVAEPYSGRHQGQITIPAEDTEFFGEAKGATLAEVIQSVGLLSESVRRLEATVNGLKQGLWAIPVITTITVAVVVLLVSMFYG